MKKNRSYSLTAKERKQKRMAEQSKQEGARTVISKPQASQNTEEAPVLSAEAQMAISQKRSKRSAIVVGCVVAVAILLIIAALITPIIMYAVNPYRGYDDVIAKFTLSNGMELEYVIDEEEYDTAATNFIFLATNKYFDNTVFYDAQGGWLRFGGFDDQPRANDSSYSRTNHRVDSADFCSAFAALPNARFNKVTDKFGYRLRINSDHTNDKLVKQLGALTFRTDTSTEFQFYYGDFAETVPNDINEIKCSMVGHALNEQTISNIQSIRTTAALNTAISSGKLWKPPTPNIMIESVRVYNLNSSKWSNFDFLDYLSGNDSDNQRRYSSWVGKN